MKILLDTSVLVAALVEKHPNHMAAFSWLQKAKDKAFTGFVAAHSIAELYSILTTLPIRPRISPTVAAQMIVRDVTDQFQVVALTQEDYLATIEKLASAHIIGGATYDALLLRAAEKEKIDRVVTFNIDDFGRISPGLAGKIISPHSKI